MVSVWASLLEQDFFQDTMIWNQNKLSSVEKSIENLDL